jgi:hypothetical protein
MLSRQSFLSQFSFWLRTLGRKLDGEVELVVEALEEGVFRDSVAMASLLGT